MTEEYKEPQNIAQIVPEPAAQPSLVPGFKSVCVRIGVMMTAVFVFRCIDTLLLAFTRPLYRDWGELGKTVLSSVTSIIFLNVIPITAGLLVLKFPLKSGIKNIYAKPRYFGRALGMFPAGYGAAIAMQIVTLLLAALFRNTAVSDSFTATENMFTTTDTASAVITFVHTVVLAPLFEEFWFRGLVLNSLKPYGNGFAIFVSAMLFGITHANLAQFFYATTIGIILGYVAVQTGSVVTTTVMHAMFNGIAGITSLFQVNPEVGKYMLNAEKGLEPEMTPAVSAFMLWTLAVLIFAFVGFIMAIVKLVRIKRYRVPKIQTEMSAKTRWGIFLSRPTVIISLLLALDTMTVAFITEKLAELIKFIFY